MSDHQLWQAPKRRLPDFVSEFRLYFYWKFLCKGSIIPLSFRMGGNRGQDPVGAAGYECPKAIGIPVPELPAVDADYECCDYVEAWNAENRGIRCRCKSP